MPYRRETSRFLALLLVFGSSVLALGQAAATRPATRPATQPGSGKPVGPATAPVQWGESKAGLQAAIVLDGDVAVGGKFLLRISLRNVGGTAVKMPAADKLFAWLFVVQNTLDGRRAYFTEKILGRDLAAGVKGFPAELPGGKALSLKAVDLAGRKAFTYRRGLKVIGGYPAPGAATDKPLSPAGTLAKVLSTGRARARLMLYLPREDETPILLVSNTLTVPVGPPDFARLSEKERQAFAAELLRRFDRDAWSAQSAHHTAVRLGKPIVPYLAGAVLQRKRPFYSRMWLATALCDIRDDRAVDTLVKLLDDPAGGVRSVVAYHGPKQRSRKLDAALIGHAMTDKKPALTAWVVRGFWTFRKTMPEKLLAAGLKSREPKARAAVAHALGKSPGERNLKRLLSLLKDADQRVRAAAASTLAARKAGAAEVVGALVAALDLPGDHAHHRICAALATLTGRKIAYDPQADKKAKHQAIQAWKDWWSKAKKERPGKAK